MTIKEQWNTLTNNWLLIVLFICGIVLLFGANTISNYGGGFSSPVMGMTSSAYDSYESSYYRKQTSDLAPDVLDRIVTKSSSINLQVNDYTKAESDLKSFTKSNDAIITNENANTAYQKYTTGYYTINVPTAKYDVLLAQIKTMGDVLSVNDAKEDITGSHLTLQDAITLQKTKLAKYNELYNQTASVSEKIQLLDTISNQEQTLISLENALKNQDNQVSYSQISLTLSEKRPTHANVIFATADDLWSSFKASLNALLYFIAYVLPFAIFGAIIWGIAKIFKKK